MPVNVDPIADMGVEKEKIPARGRRNTKKCHPDKLGTLISILTYYKDLEPNEVSAPFLVKDGTRIIL